MNERNLVDVETEKHPKALVLLSGGLDSTLATKLVIDQGIEVEAVSFITPFSTQNEKIVDRFCKELGIKVHKVFLDEEFLRLVINPTHGYGSQMNPCIDCRIHMLKKAWEIAEKVGASFLVTGEVLNERPFSQRKDSLFLIEKEAGLFGKILRPLSAKRLPETEPEKLGLIQREKLLDIEGRRRL
ncbi:MAG: 7-cyano-7-deazaguanine synthase, partial [Candidatus Bathyarchaeia archaeon]